MKATLWCVNCAILGFVVWSFRPAYTQAVSSSSGKVQVESDASNFLFARGTGTNCVHVNAKGNAANAVNDPPVMGAGACNMVVGLASIAGIGTTANKPTGLPAPSFSNTATNGGTTAKGTGTFTYVSGAILDTATYVARAEVMAPVARGVRFAGPDVAWAGAEDPVDFSATSSDVLQFSAEVTQLNLTSQGGGVSGFWSQYQINGTNIYSFSIVAPPGFSSISDLEISYSSMLGSSFDADELVSIQSGLSLDPVNGTVMLATNSLSLFPNTNLPLVDGNNELSGGSITAAGAGDDPQPVTARLRGLTLAF